MNNRVRTARKNILKAHGMYVNIWVFYQISTEFQAKRNKIHSHLFFFILHTYFVSIATQQQETKEK
jgi:hypothetical protein